MSPSFAIAADYRAIYDTDVDDGRLSALLDRASRDVAAELRQAGIAYDDPSEEFADDLSDVVCSMVHRAIGEPDLHTNLPRRRFVFCCE
jgi:hypothetical protein